MVDYQCVRFENEVFLGCCIELRIGRPARDGAVRHGGGCTWKRRSHEGESLTLLPRGFLALVFFVVLPGLWVRNWHENFLEVRDCLDPLH